MEFADHRAKIDANALEAIAKARPDDMFLKGSGVLKLIDAIRNLERENRELLARAARPPRAPAATEAPKLPVWWESFIQNICEIPDRNSPEDEPDAMIATAAELEGCALNAMEGFRATPAPAVGANIEVTDTMVAAYLKANDAYWKRTDALPGKVDKWRNGTPTEATRESLIAALDAVGASVQPVQASLRDEPMHETVNRAKALGLSFAQMQALQWVAANGDREKHSGYRNAGIATRTINSLVKAGLVEHKSVQTPLWRIVYSLTGSGNAALASSTPTKGCTSPEKPSGCTHQWVPFYTGPFQTHDICALCDKRRKAKSATKGGEVKP